MKNASGKQTLRRLDLVNFFAPDLKAAKKWYSELLDIEPYFERPSLSEDDMKQYLEEVIKEIKVRKT